jgi:hypothetical protein
MARFDPRLTPARPNLAASNLRGKVDAARFVDGTAQEVIAGQAPVREAPSHGATMLTEAFKGERVTVYETDAEGWAWGQLAGDGYVGWLPAAALLAPGPVPTHKVAALRIWRRSAQMSPISSRWPNASSARRICGAARPAWGSTAPAWCRWR